MMQTDIFNRDMARAYEQDQPYQHIAHPPILLSFSAVPGSGKTTLAQRLFHDLRTQYVSHDDMRDMIRKRGVSPEYLFMPPISRIVINHMVTRDDNKFVILDLSLDRRWDIFFDHAKELKAKTIVIRLDPSLEVVRQRLRERDGADGHLLVELDRFEKEFENCRQHVVADMTLGANYNYEEVLRTVKVVIEE